MTQPSARHRRARPSRGARLLTAALVLATLAAGTAILLVKPDQARLQRQFFVSGSTGRPVSGRTFTVTVLDATGAPKLKTAKGVLETPGLWVTVTVRVVATEEPIMLSYQRLRDDRERLFHDTGRAPQPLGNRTFQPGIAVEGALVFEVARDVRTLTLLLSSPHGLLGTQLDAVVEVDLPASVDAWRGQEQPLTVPSAKVAE